MVLHGSIFFLTCDPDGPGLVLNRDDLQHLKKMVVQRYREIIHRDLDPDNRDKTIYRGLARCLCNWQRLKRFCQREGFDDINSFRKEIASALTALLKREMADIATGDRVASLNCTAPELAWFIEELGINGPDLPDKWRNICLPDCQP